MVIQNLVVGAGRVNNVHYGLCKNGEFSHIPFVVCGWAFSLTWSASMQIYWNKWKYRHKKKVHVHVPQDCLWTLTWPPFHCFGTPIWPLWRHVKTLYRVLYRWKFVPTARALIGYFEVTWHPTMKPFPAKTSQQATLKNLQLRANGPNIHGLKVWPISNFARQLPTTGNNMATGCANGRNM